MKYLSVVAVGLALTGCQTANFISEKDSWIAIRSFGSDTVYYCERVELEKKMVPICTPATHGDFFRYRTIQDKK